MTWAILVCACGLPLPAAGPKTSGTVRVADLGEFAVRDGGVTFNNFCLGEDAVDALRAGGPTLGPRAFNTLTVRGTYRNPTREQAAFTLVVTGLNADGEVEWACQLAGVAGPTNVGVLDGQVPVHPGTLKLTPTVRVRARVVPLPVEPTAPAVVVPASGR